MRHIISRSLNEAPGLRVVGAARDGREALEQISALEPDVVTLDVEMPRLDGLAALREIMAHSPRPVIMLSTFTRKGAHETVQALMWGAVDFVAKPAARANVAVVMEEVVAKVRAAAAARRLQPAFGAAPLPRENTTQPAAPERSPALRRARPARKVVVIGASTGGPRALTLVLAGLPPNLDAAVLVVQHMPAGFTRSLAERLNTVSAIPIKEAEAGDDLGAGLGLVAPGGFHLTLDEASRIALTTSPPVHGVRPAVDVTMTAAARQFGAAAVGVVLTGMGSDGTHGAALIRAAGGRVIAEHESTCVVWGMPRSVVEAGFADLIAPLPEVAGAIESLVGLEQPRQTAEAE